MILNRREPPTPGPSISGCLGQKPSVFFSCILKGVCYLDKDVCLICSPQWWLNVTGRRNQLKRAECASIPGSSQRQRPSSQPPSRSLRCTCQVSLVMFCSLTLLHPIVLWAFSGSCYNRFNISMKACSQYTHAGNTHKFTPRQALWYSWGRGGISHTHSMVVLLCMSCVQLAF